MRRRSVTNPGDTAGSVNGGQVDGGGSGLLAGGNTDGSAGTGRDTAQQDPPAAAGGQAGQAGQGSAAQAALAAQPGTALAPVALPAGPRGTGGTGSSARSATARSRRPGSGQSRYALANWRVRYRLAAVIAVPTLIAAALGAFLIYGDVNNWVAAGRIQHVAQLNASVVKLTQALEDERDLSGAYTTDRSGNAGLIDTLKQAQNATNADAQTVANEAGGVTTGAGYDPATVQNLVTLVATFNDLPPLRELVSGSVPLAKGHPGHPSVGPVYGSAQQVIQAYTSNILSTANTFSASVGAGANDSNLQANVNTLASLLRVENQMSLQRAVLFAALSSPTKTFGPADVATLEQASSRSKRTKPSSTRPPAKPTGVLQQHDQRVAGERGGLPGEAGGADRGAESQHAAGGA